LAVKNGNQIDFKGVLFSLDGKEKYFIEKSCNFDFYLNFGQECAKELFKNGAKPLMEKLRAELKVK
jgi:hydroxymethylbilane synthase